MTDRFEVEISRSAEDDLDSIGAYVSEHVSPEAAAELLDRISEVIASLETLPMRGVVPKELAEQGERQFRQLNLGPYRLIYRIVAARVLISLVVDGRRDLPELLARRLLAR